MKLELLEKSDHALAKSLQDFRAENHKSTVELNIDSISFNGTRMRYLIHVLRNGLKNCLSQPLHQLYLTSRCSFEDEESLRLLVNFFANNEAPAATVTNVGLFRRGGRKNEQFWSQLLPAFHCNNTVKKLRLEDDGDGIRGADVSELLERNQTLTDFCLENCCVNDAFIRDMQRGLLASRGRLQSLGFARCGIGKKQLKELRLIYDANNDQHGTALTALDLSRNPIQGDAGGTRLRRLIETMPGLKKLNVSHIPALGPGGASALFQTGSAVMGRLQSLNMEDCDIGDSGLARMVSSIATDNAPLLELNLSGNKIRGQIGGESLARLFLRCKQIKCINISHNLLGLEGARALAPSMANLHCLQELDMGHCDLGDGAEAILTSIATCPCIQSLSLRWNRLPASTLAPLTEFLRAVGQGIETLIVSDRNHRLFETADNSNHQELFFNAIANHKYIRHLDISSGFDYLRLSQRGKEQLLSAVLQNSTLTLLVVNDDDYGDDDIDDITEECLRRNKLLCVIEATMEKPVGVPPALWPMALNVCSPRQSRVGPTLVYGLVQRMMEVNGFDHTAAVYRFEKVRATKHIRKWCRSVRACIRIQGVWRRHRLEAGIVFRLFRKRKHDQLALLSNENASLREQVALLRAQVEEAGQSAPKQQRGQDEEIHM